jgi:hypothetical protein
MGEGEGPAPRRVQDLALNLTWFRVGVDKKYLARIWSPLPFIPSHGGEGSITLFHYSSIPVILSLKCLLRIIFSFL